MQIETKIKSTVLFFLFLLPQLSFASNQIISTVKTPDPYNGNQSWYKLSSLPGKTIEDSVILKNLGSETETIKLYATDATSNQAGSFISKLENEPQNSIGKWTTLENSEITLTPNEDKEVKFKINIPENTIPGEYFGSIIKEDLNTDCQDSTNNCTGGIQIKTRTGNRIYLTIPGKIIEDIKLTNFSYKNSGNQSIFKFNIQNRGNVSFEPQATINIYNYWGEKIDSMTKPLGSSLPNTSIEPMVEWKHQSNYGFFTAKAEISYQPSIYSSTNTLHSSPLSERREVSIFIFPWMATIILFSVLCLITTFLYLRKKHQLYILSNTFEYSVKADENIMDIAQKHQIRWTVLAQINKLHAPYIVKPDQRIKIPKSKTQHE